MSENWGIYIHVPWCRRRCPYCDFYFEVGQAERSFDQLVMTEFQTRCGLWPKAPASTLYFGGGTPSLLPASEIQAIIEGLMSSKRLAPDAEITLEANPEDLSAPFVRELRRKGVTRISLGVQSFEEPILKYLGRKHGSREAFDAIQFCVDAGFERISVDLIFGVPEEEQGKIAERIGQLRSLGVGHISAYLLTVEPKTALQRRIQAHKCLAPDDDVQAEAYATMQKVMAENGYRQYEISSYALVGQESRHNRNYWSKGEYLGLGPAAHSMRFLSNGAVERSKNAASIAMWKKQILATTRECEHLLAQEALLESVAFGLRDLVAGIELNGFLRRHQCEVEGLADVLRENMEKGWVSQNLENSTYHLTPLGVRFSDAVAREILALPCV